jgi:S1-C subfamily serine protease
VVGSQPVSFIVAYTAFLGRKFFFHKTQVASTSAFFPLQFLYNVPKMPRKFKQEVKGLGSGIIIDSQGHILTNYHVAGGATKIQVVVSNGSQYPAKLIGGIPKQIWR